MKGKFGAMLTVMMAMASSLFKGNSVYRQEKPTASLLAGEIHIKGYGQKPEYGPLKRKEFYQKKIDAKRREHEANVWELREKGIIWTPVGNYWKNRKLAELNQN